MKKAEESRRIANGFMVRLSDKHREQLDRLAELLSLNRTSVIRLILAEELPRRLEAARPAPA